MRAAIRKLILPLVLGALILAALYWAVGLLWPAVGVDWRETFYPAAQAVLHGSSPYSVPTFRNAPWTILFLIPFALFGERSGGILYFLASLLLYAWVAYRLKARPLVLAAFLLSPPVVYGLRMLNVDAIVLVGFVLPAPVGLFFVLLKPQMGIAMLFYWLAEAWRKDGFKAVLGTFAPFTIALALSFLFFGNWLAGRQADLVDSFWNISLWPWALPIGLVLVVLSMRDRRKDFAMAASPFLSPYLAYHSWVSVLAGLLGYPLELVVAVTGMWIAGLLHGLG